MTTSSRPHLWRWMVLLSRFVVCFFSLGVFKSLGVILPYIMTDFSATSVAVGVISSASCAVGLISVGLLAGVLLKACTPRQLTMAGGALASVSLLGASFSLSLNQLAVWFVLYGVGMSLCFVTSVKPLMEYFPDDFAFANGASLAGGTAGMMVLPPVMDYLVSVYGWRRALGLMGAIASNYVVCGALLQTRNTASLQAQYSLVSSRPGENTSTSADLNDEKDHSKEGDTRNFKFVQILKKVCERFDTQILVEPLFAIVVVVSTLGGMLYTMWHLYLIPQGVELGFGDSPSAFLATFAGAGSLLGRVSHGIPIDRDLIKAPNLLIISCLVFAASNMLDPLVVSSYVAIAVIAFVSGLGFGIIYPLLFVLMRDVTGDRHMSAYGWLFVTEGVGQLLGGALAGWIHDLTREYQWVFLSMGVVSVTMATLVTSMRLMVRCSGVIE